MYKCAGTGVKNIARFRSKRCDFSFFALFSSPHTGVKKKSANVAPPLSPKAKAPLLTFFESVSFSSSKKTEPFPTLFFVLCAITCLPLRSQQQPQPSYQPWGCYQRRIIDRARVCKLACKRAEEDCSASVARSATRCKAPSLKQSAEAQRARSMRPITKIKRGQAEAQPLFLIKAYLLASSIATATATVIPTMGLLPAPMRPIISTCAGTEDEPANCASPCILPRVSVIP